MTPYFANHADYARYVASYVAVAVLVAAVVLLAVWLLPLSEPGEAREAAHPGPRRSRGHLQEHRGSVLVGDAAHREGAGGASGSLPPAAFGSSPASSVTDGSAHLPSVTVPALASVRDRGEPIRGRSLRP